MNDRLTLDHLVYGVPDLAKAIDDFEARLGLAPVRGGRHESLGTHNAILPLCGETYLELIARDPDEPSPDPPRPFGLDSLHHPQLVTWAVRSREIEQDVERVRKRNYDPGIVFPMTRKVTNGHTIAWKLALRTKPFGDGLVPFLIDWGDTTHPSRSVGHTTDDAGQSASEKREPRISNRICRLFDFCAFHPDPAPIQAAIDALGVDLEIQHGPVPGLRARLDGPSGSIDLTGPAR